MLRVILRVVVCTLAGVNCALVAENLRATDGPRSTGPVGVVSAPARDAEAVPALGVALGIKFVDGSTSSLILERDGKKYLVDLVHRTVQEAEASQSAPAAEQRLTEAPSESRQEAAAGPALKKEKRKVYEPGDDNVFTLPTGRRIDRHGFHVNFTHRFVFDPAFSGPARLHALFGLDGFSLSSFGLRFGVTDKLSVSAFRSPTFIGRPINLMAAYNFADERDAQPLNGAFRFSVEGQNDFSRNFTVNFEAVFSRSLRSRAQIYVVPTLSLNSRRLPLPNGYRSRNIPDFPGIHPNTFSIGVGASVDIRPTVALVAEVIPTLTGGRELGIHRPPYAFGIQKKLWRHAFTFGFSTSPGVTVAQRIMTRATYLGDPSADKPSGLFVGFDLTRQIY